MRCQHCRTPLPKLPIGQGTKRPRCPQCGRRLDQDRKDNSFAGLEMALEGMQGLEALRQRILVVEDSATVREAVRDLLQEAGFLVDTACDGESALRAVSRTHYDLLVLDVYLPFHNGFQVIQVLRQYPDTRDLPIIAMSGSCKKPAELRALRLSGADSFVDKGRLKADLVDRVKSALEREPVGCGEG